MHHIELNISNQKMQWLKAYTGEKNPKRAVLAVLDSLEQQASKKSQQRPLTAEECYQNRKAAKEAGMKLEMAPEMSAAGITEDMLWNL